MILKHKIHLRLVFISFIVCFFYITGFAQDKKLTIEDAVIGQYRELYPEYLRYLQWGPMANSYTYVKNYTRLVKGEMNNSKEKEIFSKNDLVNLIFKTTRENFNIFPEYKWIDESTLFFTSDSFAYGIDITKNKLLFHIKYKNEDDNFQFCYENKSIAYTKGNNIFVNTIKNKEIAVTTHRNTNIVSGQDISRREFGIDGGLFWSPKGSYLAYYQKDESDVSVYPLVNITKRVAEYQPEKYPMAGMPSEHVCIGVYNIQTGQTTYIEKDESSEKYVTCLTWGPQEEFIYVAVLNRDQNHAKLNKYDAKTGKLVKTLFEERHNKYVEPENQLYFISDNQFIWQSELKEGYNHLFIYNTDGTLEKQITSGDWVVTEINGLSNDKRSLFYTSTKEGPIERHLYKYDLKSHKEIKLTKAPGVHEPFINKDGSYFIDEYSNTVTPRVIQIINNKGKQIKNLVNAQNPLSDFAETPVTISSIKSADGKTDLYYRLIKPANFDPQKKYPVIVYVYGGPHVQLVTNSWLAGVRMWDYFMAQQGYIVFSLDNRGSTNRGLDFENVIHRQMGQEEMKDQMEGIEFLKTLSYVDANRIGVYGWSYGGFMTISLMTNYPEVFKVGVSGGPVCDWKYYEVMYGERYMDTPLQNPGGYKKSGVINKVKNLQGRLMVIHGAMDPTVVLQHSQMFVRECVKRKVNVDYFLYPNAEHNVKGYDRIHLMQKISRYFDDFL